MDQTGVGDYITEDMENAAVPCVEGVVFTAPKKEELATVIKEMMLRGELKIPYDRELIAELNVERYELKKTGVIQFSTPEGEHDDRFWSLALAVYASRGRPEEGVIISKSF